MVSTSISYRAVFILLIPIFLEYASSTAAHAAAGNINNDRFQGFSTWSSSSSTTSSLSQPSSFQNQHHQRQQKQQQQEGRPGRRLSIGSSGSNPFNLGFRNALARYQHQHRPTEVEKEEKDYSSCSSFPSSSLQLAASSSSRASSGGEEITMRIQNQFNGSIKKGGGSSSSTCTTTPALLSSSSFQHDDVEEEEDRYYDQDISSSASYAVTRSRTNTAGYRRHHPLLVEDDQTEQKPVAVMTMARTTTKARPSSQKQQQQQQSMLTTIDVDDYENKNNNGNTIIHECSSRSKQSLQHGQQHNDHQQKQVQDTRGGSGTPSLTFVENMLCGAVSRSIAQTVMHPMNTAKTMLQNGRGPDRQTLSGLMRPSQFRRLTCGAGANFILSIPHGAVNFAVLEFVRGKLNQAVDSIDGIDDKMRDRLGPGLDFLSSALATITCSVVSTPQMMITDNIMAGNYPNLVASVQGLHGNGGINGLYAGWWPGLVGKIPSYALTWTFFQQLKRTRNMLSDRPAKNYENTIMGGIASAATVCIMIPMDTIKTRLVTQSSGVGIVGKPYKGIIDCGVRIAKEEGVKTFYRGLAPRLISVVPLIAIQFSIYEYMKRQLVQHHPPSPSRIPDVYTDQYGPEEILEEAAMESSASGAHASPAPQFRTPRHEQKKSWLSTLFGVRK